ncbi:c-type cytochrome [Bacillus aquiflavi]|uniref:C-type cytochrome n=1 Tax=Bacillus aquiflavi TaxID=2672567 RepID=A0A6B3VXX5_9BACI|nr:cytochrome c [Bacillus aquiflavi]MBA4537535.1 c-type cytochrome [Bacillus aquiflavi]NEY81792.1 c-type cytochrome [Bacillus aquiflavi]
MKKKLLALLMGTSLVLVACGGNDKEDNNKMTESKNEGTTTETAEAGDAEKFYETKCLSCHGGNLEGGVGPALNDVGARLSKDEIEKVITDGRGSMPGGLLKGDEASQVADWLAAKK